MQTPGLVAYGAVMAFTVVSVSLGANSPGKSSLGKDTEVFPKPTDLRVQTTLPDPLVMFDGRKVTTPEMWRNERRPELIHLFQHYMYGQLPPKPATLTGKVERADEAAFGGKATLSEVRFKEFNNQPERLPFDQNCLVTLCAPRPVLFTNGRADTWINPAGQFEVLRAAAPVYRLLAAGDFTAEQLPWDGRLIDGVLGYYLRPGAHSLLPEDWKIFLDFADKQLGRP